MLDSQWDLDSTEVIPSIEDNQNRHVRMARLPTPDAASSHSDLGSSPMPLTPTMDRVKQEVFLTADDKLAAIDETVDLRAKYAIQVEECHQMIQRGWEQDTVLAYLKLDRRGFEPLFPSTWAMDFPLFPPLLFTDDVKNAFIRAITADNWWRAIHEFDNFCKVGMNVRSAQLSHTHISRRPEALLYRAIKNYIRWAWNDADLTEELQYGRVPELLAIMCAPRRDIGHVDRAEALQERLLLRLHSMGDRLLSTLKFSSLVPEKDEFSIDPPTLFGFAVLESFVGVVAYEPISRTSRTVGFFNFDDRHLEVMNTISLAIVIHWVRYGLMRLREALENQFQSEMSWSGVETAYTSDGPNDYDLMNEDAISQSDDSDV